MDFDNKNAFSKTLRIFFQIFELVIDVFTPVEV